MALFACPCCYAALELGDGARVRCWFCGRRVLCDAVENDGVVDTRPDPTESADPLESP